MGEPPVTVSLVETRAQLREFVDVAFVIGARWPGAPWVPPLKRTVHEALDVRRNPFYRDAVRACFIATRDGQTVGRIAAIDNRAASRIPADRIGYWGFFECVDDQRVADALFNAAATWLRDRGLLSMIGPVNPSTNHECGLLVEGGDRRPMFMTPWNPTYYASLCAAAGHTKVKDLLGLWFPVANPGFALPPFVDRVADRALTKGRVTVRHLNRWRLARDLDVCHALYNAAWDANWGFVAPSADEFRYLTKDLWLVLRHDLSFIVSVDGHPAAFALAIPDYNEALARNRSGNTVPIGLARMLRYRWNLKAFRVMALGVAPAFRNKGILAVITREYVRRAKAIGAMGFEGSWLLEDNRFIVQPMRAMGAVDRMRWRLYQRATVGRVSP